MKTKSLFMYRGIKFICLAVLLLNSFCVSSQNEVRRARVDSLHDELQKTKTPIEKLVVLKELVAMNRQQKEEVSLGKELVDIALQTDSLHIVYHTMAELTRYYYNQNMRDSMLYWNAMIDTIARRRKECPDALFTAGSLVCEEYLWAEDYELAMNEAIRLINLADKEQQEYGRARGHYNLALIYQATGQDSSAVAAFRKGLVGLDKNSDKPLLELNYLSDMLLSTLRLNLLEDAEEILARSGKLLDKLEDNYKTKGYIFPTQFHRCLLNIRFSELYTRKGQLEKARAYLDRASVLMNDSLGGFVKVAYYQSAALYNSKAGNNREALAAVDSALLLQDDLEMMTLKMQVLRKSGRLAEAISVYRDMLHMNASIRDGAFNRQITQLRTLNDLNDNEKQARELKYQAAQIDVKQRQLIHVVIAVIVLLLFVGLLYHQYRRTHRLKNELLGEKESLIESEKQLRRMKEKAVEANHLKTVFISNISHEIRTPLNAIVGFSELLVDTSFPEEEKVTFAATINHSSELLMNLINDVLDLSRLESGNYSFTIKEWDVAVLCREILAAMENKVLPAVKLTFTPPVDSFLLNTDRFRLHQLLGQLLSNAIKFTREGEVNLTVEVDPEKDAIRFIITDTGCGIPIEMHTKIFERFEKLDEFKQGTGLGLAICRLVAAQFEGSLYIDSSYTDGARFVFVHPCNLAVTTENRA